MIEKSFETQIEKGDRFGFGENWKAFLSTLNDNRIKVAEESLTSMLEETSFFNKSFLDIGNGSGLFSLAARNLGARVHSFDFDVSSVECVMELKRRYFPDDPNWKTERESVLNLDYLKSLGEFDIVYSWGVLHHTNQMWKALENVDVNVKKGGKLYISIYNDQGRTSARWLLVKKIYNRNAFLKFIVKTLGISYFASKGVVADLWHLKNPFTRYKEYQKNRGMSMLHDWIDWLGGYPFEVATPDAIFNFYKIRGYELEKLITRQGLGCNIFVFKKNT